MSAFPVRLHGPEHGPLAGFTALVAPEPASPAAYVGRVGLIDLGDADHAPVGVLQPSDRPGLYDVQTPAGHPIRHAIEPAAVYPIPEFVQGEPVGAARAN